MEKKQYLNTTEWCDRCETEVKLPVKLGVYVCPNCGNYLVNCSICHPDTTICNRCEHGRIGNICTKIDDNLSKMNFHLKNREKLPSFLSDYRKDNRLSFDDLSTVCDEGQSLLSVVKDFLEEEVVL